MTDTPFANSSVSLVDWRYNIFLQVNLQGMLWTSQQVRPTAMCILCTFSSLAYAFTYTAVVILPKPWKRKTKTLGMETSPLSTNTIRIIYRQTLLPQSQTQVRTVCQHYLSSWQKPAVWHEYSLSICALYRSITVVSTATRAQKHQHSCCLRWTCIKIAQQIKVPFMKKLRADWSQGMLAVIRCRNFCLHLLSKKLNIKISRIIILSAVLYGCENCSLTLRKKRWLRIFEKRLLRRIFGPKWDEVTGGVEKTTQWGALWLVLLSKYYSDDQIKKNKTGRKFST
jgi:hypothetical protein